MNNSTLAVDSHLHFENAVGRVIAHPQGHYVAIEYYAGPRQPSELQTFLVEAGSVLLRWGWNSLLTTHLSMPSFTQEEIEEIRNYWQLNAPQRPGILYGALLLPHSVFARLSFSRSATSFTSLSK
jgi:hypothetical protein